MVLQDSRAWAMIHFGGADLGDHRRGKKTRKGCGGHG